VSDKVRLFVGVRVSMEALAELTELRRTLARRADDAGLKVRWVAPATYHVTLAFLGWSRSEVVEPLRDRIGDALAGQRRFRFTGNGLGAFPRPDKARVVWAGVSDGGELAELAGRVGRAAGELGFAIDDRPFHPHVTLGRCRKVADLSELLLPYAEQAFSETSVESVILFESIMKSSGSEYVERASWGLEAASKDRKRQTDGLDPSLTGHSSTPGED
jgi:2'-5' RNA ligase